MRRIAATYTRGRYTVTFTRPASANIADRWDACVEYQLDGETYIAQWTWGGSSASDAAALVARIRREEAKANLPAAANA